MTRGARSAILIIDDSASVREVLRVALESEGYRVIEAADGGEGLRLCRDHRPAFAIVELVLPDMNGFEVSWRLGKIEPRLMIFTMSDERSDSDYWSTARMAGAEQGFRKPVQVKELLGVIHFQVAHSELARKFLAGEISRERFFREVDRLYASERRIGMDPIPRRWVESYLRSKRRW